MAKRSPSNKRKLKGGVIATRKGTDPHGNRYEESFEQAMRPSGWKFVLMTLRTVSTPT
jgi:hypothetical protein